MAEGGTTHLGPGMEDCGPGTMWDDMTKGSKNPRSPSKRSNRLGHFVSDLLEIWRLKGPRSVYLRIRGYVAWRLAGAPLPGADEVDRNKYRRNLQLIRAMGREPFMRLVQRAQEEVAAVSDPHYVEEYKETEVHYWAAIARWLFERSQQIEGARTLDIGCGAGTLAVYMSRLFGSPARCTDMLSRRSTAELSERGIISFQPCNIEMDPLPFEGPFEIVVFTEVLEHLNFDPVPTLIKLRDVLSPDGRIYLSTPDATEWGRVTQHYPSLESMPSPMDGHAEIERGERTYVDDHIWQYDRGELLGVVDRAGLVVVREEFSPGVLNRHFNVELAGDLPEAQGRSATTPVRGPT